MKKTIVNIDNLQKYLEYHYLGRANEQSMFMKLVEEIGEVAEVLNKRAGRKKADLTTEDKDLTEELGIELADVIHYAVAIAAINNINLNDIILEKDKKASIKYNHDINLYNFINKNN